MRQPDTGSFVFCPAMQPLENDKDPFQELRLNADPIVCDHEFPISVLLHRFYMYQGYSVRMSEFYGIRDKVLQKQL
jgi:hypothetical protein